MRQIYTDLGLEGTTLVVRDADSGVETRRLAGEEIKRVVELLGKLEELVRVVQRRGIDFADFLSRRDSSGWFLADRRRGPPAPMAKATPSSRGSLRPVAQAAPNSRAPSTALTPATACSWKATTPGGRLPCASR